MWWEEGGGGDPTLGGGAHFLLIRLCLAFPIQFSVNWIFSSFLAGFTVNWI